MKRTTLAVLMIMASQMVFAQPQHGMKQIESLCGCYAVNFKYAETFAPDKSYKFHDREEMNATELALPVEKTNDRIVIQHLLIVQDTMVIKHWREEWTYEPASFYRYLGNRVWQKSAITADAGKGRWLQTVWEVSDEPRYQGLSSWMQNDGKTYWESTADAPLPRREYTVRNDYNIMKRHNRIILTADGYVHEQDNEKIVRTDKGDNLIAQEKGYNTYYKMDDTECKAAQKWWNENEPFWKVVRDEWSKVLAGRETIALKDKVNDKVLNEHLTALWREWRGNRGDVTDKIEAVIKSFLNDPARG